MTMRIKFLVDFRGRETREAFFERGQVAQIDDEVGCDLVRRNVAEVVEDAPTPQLPQPEAQTATTTKKGRK